MIKELELIKSLEERIEKLEQAIEAQYNINKAVNESFKRICNAITEE